jgi:hypothetical protein
MAVGHLCDTRFDDPVTGSTTESKFSYRACVQATLPQSFKLSIGRTAPAGSMPLVSISPARSNVARDDEASKCPLERAIG